ncbi:MAG: hypothetical protein QOD78_923, partial [Chloroflexota bacterium]|nr:hypothetical protein [Chloroflexota bacterium]
MRNHTHTPRFMQPPSFGVKDRRWLPSGRQRLCDLVPYHRESMARHDRHPTLPATRPAGICAGPGHVLIYG